MKEREREMRDAICLGNGDGLLLRFLCILGVLEETFVPLCTSRRLPLAELAHAPMLMRKSKQWKPAAEAVLPNADI